MDEFKAPQNRKEQTIPRMQERTVLKPLDQAVITILSLIVFGLLSWMAWTNYQNSLAIQRLDSKFESIKQDRDLSLIYIERRLQTLETSLTDINKRIDGHDRRE